MVKQDIKECLESNYMPYAVSVIVDRAIPSIDGFKPSHTKLLYTMYKMGLLNKPRTKSANIVGQTMKLNPHGDSSIYETMVRMTKNNEALSIPFVDSKGNFGKVYSRDMAYAASRYTEAKLSPVSNELFCGIEKNSVDMIDNYDGTTKEPSLLPVSFPTILSNVTTGIAVGLASNICSFNLSEICDYTINTINEMPVCNLIPDFSTGGEIIAESDVLESINKYGKGSIKLRSKYRYDKDNSCIDIYEIPYTTTIETIIDKIEDLVKQNKIKEITDVRDESDLSGLKITIDIKKNVDSDLLMKKLFKMTPLQDTFSCNFNVLINGKPKLLGVKSIIDEWIKFRKQCLRRELEYDIKQTNEEVNKLLGLSIILNYLDKAISIIRSSKSEPEAMSKLQDYFSLNKAQVEYICTIKLINMNEDWLKKKIDKLESLNKSLDKMKTDINSNEYYKTTITSQLKHVKNTYGKPRHTTIVHEDEIDSVNQADLIENYNCNIVLSKQGYVKKTLRYSDNQKLKDDDVLLQQIQSTNKSKLLLFTDKANCYYVNAYDLDQTQPSNLGMYLPSMLQLEDENIISVISTEDFNGCVLFAFENGKVAKINLKSYETKTNRAKVVNAYNTTSKLASINHIEKDADFIATSSIDKVLVFNTEQINCKDTKSSQGVNVLKSKNNSIMVECKPCNIDNSDYYRASIPAVGKYRK